MKFHEGLNQANPRGEFHPIGARKVIEKRQKQFPWRKYKEHYVWRGATNGNYPRVAHKHKGSSFNPWWHYWCDWRYLGNEYPFFH